MVFLLLNAFIFEDLCVLFSFYVIQLCFCLDVVVYLFSDYLLLILLIFKISNYANI